jgi:glycosyltransferase involved in cell wall biosynthesis
MSALTVIVPVLNAMPYLSESLASLETQSFRDFEVCFWDNGSTDGSVEEARRWIPGRLKGRVVSGNPLPLHECLARMVEEARTEFVARMDGDDICLPHRFEKQMAAMREDSGLAALGGQMELITEEGEWIKDFDNFPVDFVDVLCRMMVQCPMPHPAVMMRREKILLAGNYRFPKPVEDTDLWFRAARVGALRNLDVKLVKYRVRSKSVTNQAKQDGTHMDSIRDCLRSNYPMAFGIPEGEFDLLWGKRHSFAVRPIYHVAKTIGALSGVDLRDVLARPEFLFSARCYTAKWDVLSKFVYRFWGRGRIA